MSTQQTIVLIVRFFLVNKQFQLLNMSFGKYVFEKK